MIPLKKSHLQQILAVSRRLISGDNIIGQEKSPDGTLPEYHSTSSFFLLSCHCTVIKPENGQFKTVHEHLRTKEKTNTSEDTLGNVEYDIKFDLGEQSHISVRYVPTSGFSEFSNCESYQQCARIRSEA